MWANLGDNWEKDQRCVVISNGIDVPTVDFATSRGEARLSLGVIDADELVVNVGRPGAAKNRPGVLKIFAGTASVKAQRSAHAHCRTEPDELLALNALAHELDVGDFVQFTGATNRIFDYLLASTWCSNHRREGLPGVILEACAVGTPA